MYITDFLSTPFLALLRLSTQAVGYCIFKISYDVLTTLKHKLFDDTLAKSNKTFFLCFW